MAPTIFSIYLSAMLEEAFRDMGDGDYIQSRHNADLSTVAHFRTKKKTQITIWLIVSEYTCERTDFCRR